MYGIGYAVSRERGSPNNNQLIAQFDALTAKIVADADGDWVLAGVDLGLDLRGRPIKAAATMCVAVASDLTATQRRNLEIAIQDRAPYARTVFYAGAMTEATLIARLRQFLGEQGCDLIWLCAWDTPTATGDQAALLAKFTPA